jgi:hypothetical protein
VSYDLYFWPAGAAGEPGRLAGRLAEEEEADELGADERVLSFRGKLLRRWPELADMIAPWHHDLDWRQPWGRTDLADRFVGLTLPLGWTDTAALPALADAYGLDCYDPQHDAVLRPGEAATRGFRGDRVDVVRGRVNEDNIVRLMAQISGYIGYSYDDLDEVALTGALDRTDDEAPDGWFQYPLQGSPALLVHLAQSPGSAVVSVRVEGNLDPVLTARVETLMDPL